MEPDLLSPARPTRELAWATGLAVLVQLALFATATGPGLAGTADSGYYLHAAHTLRETGHLLNPDGTAYRYWPPLYPVLLWACGSLAAIRVLHGCCLVGSLLLWSWLGAQLLPARRALLLPLLLALSTPWLLVSKFVWAESGFLLFFAAYAVLLWQALRTGRAGWWVAVTAVGFLVPLQRTLGLFLLAGVGVRLLACWRQLSKRSRWWLVAHLALSSLGGVLWQYYALRVGPSRYHPSRGWSQLLSSAADFGFVLSRWLLPWPSVARTLLPAALWAAVLLLVFGLLWPRYAQAGPTVATNWQTPAPPRNLLLRTLWSTSLALVALVAALTVFSQSAAGIHDAERYASVLFGPVVILVLAGWPIRAPRWLGWMLAAGWLLTAALRVGHVAHDFHRLKPLVPGSFARPEAHGQRVGAVGQ